jgi:hypothetical protein
MAWARRIVLGAFGLAAAAALAASQGPPAPEAKEPDTTAEDQKTLRDIGVNPDGASLLEYFRKRTLPAADPKKIEQMIRQLGDDDFATREEAHAGLAALGAAASGGLKLFEKDGDTEVRKRVLELEQRIEAKAEPAVQSAAARLVAKTRPAGAADVLLAYVPFAVDTGVVDEVCKALGAVAVRDGKLEPAVLKALEDSVAVKRAAAAEAVIRAGAEAQQPAARALLKDTDAQVRLRVALALVSRKDKEAVPVLIDLLGELGPEQLWPAEDVLVRLAGEKAPPVSLGTNEATRKAAREAWQKWYTDHRDAVDLAKLEQAEALLGYTLLVHQTPNRVVNGKFQPPAFEVLEIKPDKSVRWKFTVNSQPVDAQVVGENRVLIAEFQGMRVSERDFKGNEVWSKPVPGNPIAVQRMPNGNTFVVLRNGLFEYDRKGNEVFAYQRPQHDIVRGKKLRTGDVVYVTNIGNAAVFTRMEPKTQKAVKTFNIGPVNNIFGGMDVLPGGGILVTSPTAGRVVEYDADGKEVKSFNVQWPLSAVRLPNGNVLVASQNPGRVVELNPAGQEVWAYQAEGAVFNAKRR